MSHRDDFTIEAVRTALGRALRHGGRAAHLVRYTPSLVDLLCPAEDRGRPPHERALVAEEMIRTAIGALGGRAEVLFIVLGLSPGSLELTLEERRQRAAAALGILPATFRRDRHEGLLLWDLATEIYRRARETEDERRASSAHDGTRNNSASGGHGHDSAGASGPASKGESTVRSRPASDCR